MFHPQTQRQLTLTILSKFALACCKHLEGVQLYAQSADLLLKSKPVFLRCIIIMTIIITITIITVITIIITITIINVFSIRVGHCRPLAGACNIRHTHTAHSTRTSLLLTHAKTAQAPNPDQLKILVPKGREARGFCLRVSVLQ